MLVILTLKDSTSASNAKSQFIGKDPDSGKDWRQKEKEAAEDKMVSITDSMDTNSTWEIVSRGEKEITTHSSILAWRILWTEEPGGLLSMGSHRVGYDWSDLACMRALEKEMATHSSVPAWSIPETEEPGGLPSMGSHRVGHDWSDLAAAAAVSRGQRSLVCCRLRGGKKTLFWLTTSA